ncbi:Heme chaperone HemW OS=Tsukamurella paurometabola (strain ATCC 8368 / DSM / CCUG 35730 / CIP 100753 / JCM 10117 / KCTC 9821 / NBRC 16120 / NCIMB 702349/ NCTC 13040) OX=521096 GN=Tpau_2770 PE=3 SV=1 [Tsukamurella paurometabola]|uniref:Heme chaperone HemW n=1 Tax=Tsukamurella paurometabola (strain ATCC 8368 / DSM 20162 / CCUG 35730 / CIP 100753 / JCM 10117 / KCTC 9821 / NBRC 16120 / NCIMB 702349 / NCTC 13040) TaxID=521096 RepID=D5UT83_TSUPD|nr:radical SAM family heme chaperone HemW [Tsukamurella paurometabola]ADG79368.1 oxygen-independent coproporphyrinogen III oxidase [Tsukamurella paurometabola DSM 20162]SUP35278.1 Oxygen-independent coproporphyrinogen-III oxidase [Tsukamurella paurometabola]
MTQSLAAPTLPSLEGSSAPFGLYLHVPFCATRCGYCDFNTYTAGELGGSSSPQAWAEAIDGELALARATVGDVPVHTVFVGGGTPSLLGGDGLAALLDTARRHFRFVDNAEITTESNPESTSPEFFRRLRDAGFTRVSLGMQSAAAHVLTVLDRTHTPGRAVAAAKEARAAGFEHVNLDLIYGTPGETDADLAASLDAVLDAGVDHVSAYALIVEDGTALARRIRRGELPDTDDDVLARRYEQVDGALRGAGFDWYEVSNWARSDAARCHHNELYWEGANWWGAGPGAHGHIAGTRVWNIKHPARYADAVGRGELPLAGHETLTAEQQHVEDVMLRVRMRSGLPLAVLRPAERERADAEAAEGNLDRVGAAYVLTDAGRLLADGVVRRILD